MKKIGLFLIVCILSTACILREGKNTNTYANDITPTIQQHITTSLDKMIEKHGIFSLPVMNSGFNRIYQKYGTNTNLLPYLDVMSGYIAERMQKFGKEYVYKDIAIEDKIFRIHYNKNCIVSSIENLEYSLGYGGAYKQFRVGPKKDDSELCMSGDNIGITIYTDNSMNNYLKKYIEDFEETELVGDAGIGGKPLVDDYFALKESFLKQVPFKEIGYKLKKTEDIKNREKDFQTENYIYNKFLYGLYVMYPLGYSEGKKFIYFTDSIKIDFLISREPLFTKSEEKYVDLLQETLKKADNNMKNIYFEIIE